MRWQQHGTSPDGAAVVREMEHPCVNGCGEQWKYPAAERDRVVEQPDQLPERARGLADEAATIGTDFIVAAVRERFPGWGTADPTRAPGE